MSHGSYLGHNKSLNAGDLFAHMMDNVAPSMVMLVTQDPCYAYPLAVLRNRRHSVTLVAPNLRSVDDSLKSQASSVLDWRRDILGLNETAEALNNTNNPLNSQPFFLQHQEAHGQEEEDDEDEEEEPLQGDVAISFTKDVSTTASTITRDDVDRYRAPNRQKSGRLTPGAPPAPQPHANGARQFLKQPLKEIPDGGKDSDSSPVQENTHNRFFERLAERRRSVLASIHSSPSSRSPSPARRFSSTEHPFQNLLHSPTSVVRRGSILLNGKTSHNSLTFQLPPDTSPLPASHPQEQKPHSLIANSHPNSTAAIFPERCSSTQSFLSSHHLANAHGVLQEDDDFQLKPSITSHFQQSGNVLSTTTTSTMSSSLSPGQDRIKDKHTMLPDLQSFNNQPPAPSVDPISRESTPGPIMQSVALRSTTSSWTAAGSSTTLAAASGSPESYFVSVRSPPSSVATTSTKPAPGSSAISATAAPFIPGTRPKESFLYGSAVSSLSQPHQQAIHPQMVQPSIAIKPQTQQSTQKSQSSEVASSVASGSVPNQPEVPPPLQIPKDLTVFLPLIRRVQELKGAGQSLTRSNIGPMGISPNDRKVLFSRAAEGGSPLTFSTYVELAQAAGLVTTGGSGNFAWIDAAPGWELRLK